MDFRIPTSLSWPSLPRHPLATVTKIWSVVARSEPVDDQYERLRTYPSGPLFAHVSGFFSFNYGASGVEHVYNADLAGRRAEQQFRNLGDWLIGKDRTGERINFVRMK